MEVVKLAVASVALTFAFSFTVFVGTRGQGESRPDIWWYDYGDGQYPSSTWARPDSDKDGIMEYYYFDKDGWLLTDTAMPDGHQVNTGGRWTTYGQIRRAYSTAAMKEVARTTNDKAHRPREAVRNHGKDGSSNEGTGGHVGGSESPFTQQTF